ncbi:MAG: hypothetical protein J7647_29535, partial [Cyanobacteria bacterium SBLK]|nr:hypothetical protein [Cyanobacteria bacterium SBLK]
PPEQFGGKAYPASDLYSLGATLIAIATGKQPADLPQKNLKIDFERETSLSADFTHWLRWLIEPDLDLRLSSANEALQTLENPCLPPKPLQIDSPTIVKPNDSKIILRQKQDTLHIMIPASGFGKINLASKIGNIILFIIGLHLFSPLPMSILFAILAALAGEFAALISIPFTLISAGIGLAFMFPFLKCFLWETHLKIDSVNILMYNSLIVRINHKKAARRNFLALRSEDGVLSRPRLLLTTSDQIFDIPDINAEEKDWLADQISQWLQVPIYKN